MLQSRGRFTVEQSMLGIRHSDLGGKYMTRAASLRVAIVKVAAGQGREKI
jgi:hypothetical protein